jgi:hypothetical protein
MFGLVQASQYIFCSEEYGKMGAQAGIIDLANRMDRPNLLSILAMVGQSLPDLYYCLVCPAGRGWEGSGWD